MRITACRRPYLLRLFSMTSKAAHQAVHQAARQAVFAMPTAPLPHISISAFSLLQPAAKARALQRTHSCFSAHSMYSMRDMHPGGLSHHACAHRPIRAAHSARALNAVSGCGTRVALCGCLAPPGTRVRGGPLLTPAPAMHGQHCSSLECWGPNSPLRLFATKQQGHGSMLC